MATVTLTMTDVPTGEVSLEIIQEPIISGVSEDELTPAQRMAIEMLAHSKTLNPDLNRALEELGKTDGE